MAQLAESVAAVRRFNRFYTRAMGVLDRSFLGGAYNLTETRVLYEIAHGDGLAPKAIGESLGLDPGYLSRIVAKFERDGLVARERSPADGRSVALRLTPEGQAHFAKADARQVGHVEDIVARLSSAQRARLARALDDAQHLLGGPPARAQVVLRPHGPGDMGWVVERHGVLYGREYGWGEGMEALTARIVADFLEHRDAARERCWIAERAGERLGCVFLVKESDEVARLRLLLLEPSARGLGLGRRLVDECVGFARAAGYREMVLWTHAVLTVARKIYADVGFEITESWSHAEFGQEEISETWRLKL